MCCSLRPLVGASGAALVSALLFLRTEIEDWLSPPILEKPQMDANETPRLPPPLPRRHFTSKTNPLIIVAAIAIPVALLGFCSCCGIGWLAIGPKGSQAPHSSDERMTQTKNGVTQFSAEAVGESVHSERATFLKQYKNKRIAITGVRANAVIMGNTDGTNNIMVGEFGSHMSITTNNSVRIVCRFESLAAAIGKYKDQQVVTVVGTVEAITTESGYIEDAILVLNKCNYAPEYAITNPSAPANRKSDMHYDRGYAEGRIIGKRLANAFVRSGRQPTQVEPIAVPYYGLCKEYEDAVANLGTSHPTTSQRRGQVDGCRMEMNTVGMNVR